MNFASYQSRGQLEAPYQHYTKPANLQVDNSGERMLARANADTAKVIVEGFNNWREQYDQGKVMEANNEYNRLMSEGTAELMQKKQENALNVVEDYDKLHQKSLEKVRKKYGQFINYGKAGQAFNIYTERDNNTRREHMMKYQMAETDAYHETQFNNQLATCMEIVGSGGYSDAAISEGINRALPLVQQRYGNYGKEMVQQQMMAAKRGMVESALSFAVSMNDYTRMQDICNKYRDSISPSKMAATLAMIGKRRQDANNVSFYQRMKEDLGHGATPEQVETWIRANYQPPRSQAGNTNGRTGRNLPLYKQWDEDWEDVPFSQGTLGTSGCAPTSMAMAMSWATGKYISPVEVANYATENGLVASDGVHGADFVPAVAAHYQVEMRKTDDQEEVINLLRQGIPVVAAHDRGMFTKNGHFLVYSGIDADGRVMINDPNGGVYHSDDATFSLDEIFNQESADYYVIDKLPEQSEENIGAVYDDDFYRMDVEEAVKKGLSEYQHSENVYKATENAIISKASDEMQDLMNNGVTDVNQYQAIVDKYATTNHVRVSLEKTVAAVERRNERATQQGAQRQPSEKVNDTDMDILREEISKGEVTKSDIINYCAERGITSQTEINKCTKLLKEYMENKGEWAIPYKEIKEYCGIDKEDIADKKKFDIAFNKVCRWQYKEMLRENNGQLPEGWEQDLEKRVRDSYEKEFHGIAQYRPQDSWWFTPDVVANEEVAISNADLAAAGYIAIEPIGDGDEYWLLRDDGSKTYMTGEQVMALKGMAGYAER